MDGHNLAGQRENNAVAQVIISFLKYEEYALKEVYSLRVKKWESISERQKGMIPNYTEYLANLKTSIQENAKFFKSVAEYAMQSIKIEPEEIVRPSDMDMSKTCSLLTQVYREWSAEAISERCCSHSRLIQFLRTVEPSKTDILIPGCGTGRLLVDLSQLGYNCEGNEYSYHMLLVSQYFLNAGLTQNQAIIYPFIHCFSHWKGNEDQLTPIKIPDIEADSLKKGMGSMSICAGSFVDCYGRNQGTKISSHYTFSKRMQMSRAKAENSKDVVITQFFIDTGPNILDYLDTIVHVLKPGGIWCNFGPLLYHFESDHGVETTYEVNPYSGFQDKINDSTPLMGLELSSDAIISIATNRLNFKLIQRESGILSGYGRYTGPESCAMPGYMCHFWVLKWTPSGEL
ncbi:S-adenosylmethionine-dependent methyltransferase SKDI_14G2320 [Saccharomyces kudriavzevii IFO 1802]|uniref:carnosine N-methyltransferase n=2 Tax=Saccharomyces kudriavzevii (strain ATCC MYA-4449 / AS 2.2408 / CBS 8840 / NBRC 1802 / NCYC 2889) TaxID=226230 RepID=J4TTM7_SACK1|nr:uncharacterized protein SKDI_14G2320 [Saccharomyces kudriavzevii IFO 1802]EJT41715.1 YNL092W-like protein [Saccharomyces kudriavzevii IFO 1802]CAI4050014.1 hypothetical protein SKDI_14G2320 [Saccharomyces kudriavzevii IFO 1802]